MQNLNKEELYKPILKGIENKNIPRYVFKYMDSKSAIEVIKNNSIKFNSTSNFNDPFDGKALVNNTITYQDMVNSLGLNNLSDKEKIIAIIQSQISPNEMPNITQLIFDNFDRNTSVSCFSEVCDSLLMWSHYANKHEGVCMKFDIIKDLDFFIYPNKVNYSEKFISYDFSDVKKNIYAQYTTKSLDWKYEKEIRIIKTNTKPNFIEFKKEALVEISFGCRAREHFINEMINLLKYHSYDNIVIKKARISQQYYKIIFE